VNSWWKALTGILVIVGASFEVHAELVLILDHTAIDADIAQEASFIHRMDRVATIAGGD
jgi:hypothetical protein